MTALLIGAWSVVFVTTFLGFRRARHDVSAALIRARAAEEDVRTTVAAWQAERELWIQLAEDVAGFIATAQRTGEAHGPLTLPPLPPSEAARLQRAFVRIFNGGGLNFPN